MTWKIYVALGVVVALLGAVAFIQRVATNDALQGVERESRQRGDTARDARDRFDACPDGMWNYATNKCASNP